MRFYNLICPWIIVFIKSSPIQPLIGQLTFNQLTFNNNLFFKLLLAYEQ